MKKPLSIILTLIEINIIVVILSVAFVMGTRNQQIEITEARQQWIPESESIEGKIKEENLDYQSLLVKKEEIIRQYAQKLQEVDQQLQKSHLENQELTQINRLQKNRLNQFLHQSNSLQPLEVSQHQVWEVPTTRVNALSSPPSRREGKKETPLPETIAYYAPEKVSVSTEQPLKQNPEKNHQANYTNREPNKSETKVNSPSEKNSIPDTAPNFRPTYYHVAQEDSQDISISYANDLAYGLAIAVNEGQINHNTRMYRKVQTAIKILRKGESKEKAIRQAKVPDEVIEQLLKWGGQRPGRLIAREIDPPSQSE